MLEPDMPKVRRPDGAKIPYNELRRAALADKCLEMNATAHVARHGVFQRRYGLLDRVGVLRG
jgi:hypothetical protein